MRTALTIGLIAGSEVWEFLYGPETDIPTQRAEFKRLRGQHEHPKYAEVQLWESGAGIVGRHRYRQMEPEAHVAAPEGRLSAGLTANNEQRSSGAPEIAPAGCEPVEADDDDAKADFAVPSSGVQPQPGRGRKRR